MRIPRRLTGCQKLEAQIRRALARGWTIKREAHWKFIDAAGVTRFSTGVSPSDHRARIRAALDLRRILNEEDERAAEARNDAGA